MEKSDFNQSEFIIVKTNFNKLNLKVWVFNGDYCRIINKIWNFLLYFQGLVF